MRKSNILTDLLVNKFEGSTAMRRIVTLLILLCMVAYANGAITELDSSTTPPSCPKSPDSLLCNEDPVPSSSSSASSQLSSTCDGGTVITSICIPFTRIPSSPPPAFGHSMRSLFTLAPTYINFNSGSFGGAPAAVLQQREAWSQLCEARPDAWYRNEYKVQTRIVRAHWAKYVNSRVDDLVLVENTSAGINAIVRSFPFNANDGILLLSTAYDMVQTTVAYTQQRYNLEVHVAQIQFPVIDATSFTRPLQAVIDRQPKGSIKMCIFSHITSVPAIIVPIELLAQQCKSIGAVVVIDGAHAVGQIPVDMVALESADIDFYVANGHKWLFGVHGTAMLWVKSQFQSDKYIVPAVLSKTTNYVDAFEYTGTRDYDAYASLNATFNFRSWLGDTAIQSYIKSLADEGANYLAQLWGTELGVPLTMTHAMVGKITKESQEKKKGRERGVG